MVDRYYLKNILESEIFQKILQSKSNGTAQKFISLGLIRSLPIPLPSLKEQTLIASLFESIETAIEQVELQEKNLLNLKNQLLQELFSDKLQFENYLSEKDFEKIKFDEIAFNISERVESQKLN